jgi:hypothetical protein
VSERTEALKLAAKIARKVADEQRKVRGRPGESVARHIAKLIEMEMESHDNTHDKVVSTKVAATEVAE